MTKGKLTNREDALLARRGLLPPEQVRTVEVEALVDTGATTLVLPAEIYRTLGLGEAGRGRVRCADGRRREIPWVTDLYIEILGRGMGCDALDAPLLDLPRVA